MEAITFDQLPQAVTQLHDKLDNIVRLLMEQSQPQQTDTDQLFTIKQAGEFICLSVPTIYGLVHRGEIPVSKRGKRLYFSKKELTDWIKAGRKKTNDEIAIEANNYLRSNKRKRG